MIIFFLHTEVRESARPKAKCREICKAEGDDCKAEGDDCRPASHRVRSHRERAARASHRGRARASHCDCAARACRSNAPAHTYRRSTTVKASRNGTLEAADSKFLSPPAGPLRPSPQHQTPNYPNTVSYYHLISKRFHRRLAHLSSSAHGQNRRTMKGQTNN